MIQTTINFNDSDLSFLNNFKQYGFENKSDLIRTALAYMKQKFAKNDLKESADLYAEIYNEDKEVQEMTKSAMSGWPL